MLEMGKQTYSSVSRNDKNNELVNPTVTGQEGRNCKTVCCGSERGRNKHAMSSAVEGLVKNLTCVIQDWAVGTAGLVQRSKVLWNVCFKDI